MLEDQTWPKRCGHLAGKEAVTTEEWLTKLRAVLDVRQDLFVMARTDALNTLGLDAAIDRAWQAAALGVDALLLVAPTTTKEMAAIGQALGSAGPALVIDMTEGGRTPLLSRTELHSLGFSLVLAPLGGLFAASQRLLDAYQAVQADEPIGTGHLKFDEFLEIVGLPTLEAREQWWEQPAFVSPP